MADENKPVDKDLTMLQDKSDQQPSIEDVFAGSKVIDITPNVSNVSQAEQVQADQEAQDRFYQTFAPGEADVDLDQYKSMFESTNDVRARNQSEAVKGLKAVGGGILQGGLIALEQFGYVFDRDTYLNLFRETEDFSGNQWTRLMKETQESLRGSDAFKIYEEEADENSIASQIFKWSSLEGAVSSAVGFGIAGAASAGLVGYLGAAGKVGTMFKYADAVLGGVTGGALGVGTTEAFASSVISNYFMGQMMATDTYNQSVGELKPLIDSGEMTEMDAKKLAANNAQEVVNLNMALSLTSYLKFKNIFKRGGKLRQLTQNPTAMNQMKQLIKTGSPTAFVENVYQEMIQMEQIHDTKREAGLDSEYSDNFWDRAANLALSNRAVHAGALGVVGGPIQFATIQMPFNRDMVKRQREQHLGEKERLSWQNEYISNNFEGFKKYESVINEAMVAGDARTAVLTDDLQIIDEMVKSATWGTLGYLKNDIQKVQKMSAEEAVEAGYTDADYQETAQSLLTSIEKAESYMGKYAGLANTAEMVHNAMVIDRVSVGLLKTIGEHQTFKQDIGANAITALGLDTGTKFSDDMTIVREEGRFENMESADKKKLQAKEKAEDKSLEKFLRSDTRMEDFGEATTAIKRHNKLLERLGDLRTKYLTEKYQSDYAKKQKQATDNVKENMAQQTAEKTTEEAKKEASNFISFVEVKKNAPQETEEARAARLAEWDAEVSGVKVTTPRSFSSIDADGIERVYTPHDLTRSKDGRFFRVKAQSKLEGMEYRANLPIVYETDANGKMVEGGKLFVVTDNTFLRDERRRAVVNAKGKFSHYTNEWSTYAKTDSLLKPADRVFATRRVEKAIEGEVNGINLTAEQVRNDESDWGDRYTESESLNLPFQGEYDVTMKARTEDSVTYVDVYKDGKLLTRLDKDYNLNYTAVTNALVKGEVTGKVIEHYSTSKNINRNTDEFGESVARPLGDLLGMEDHYLPNGKVVLAFTKGNTDFNPINVAVGVDGVIYADEKIEVDQADGTKTSMEIPFNSMRAGDTYALIVGPGNRLVPVATSAKNIADLPSQIGGENFVSDIIAEMEKTKDFIFAEDLKDEAEADRVRGEQVDTDNEVSASDRAYTKSKRKYEALNIYNKYKDIQAHLEETAYRHLRPNKMPASIITTYEGKSIQETDSRKRKLKNSQYFLLTYDVAQSDNTVVPAVEVRNPRDFTKTKRYNVKDHLEEFTKIVGGRRQRVSINMVADESMTKSEKAEQINDILHNQGLTTDININQPFLGSSATIALNGTDIIEEGTARAEKENISIKERFKDIPEPLQFKSEEAAENAVEEVNEKLNGLFAQEEGEYSLSLLAQAEGSEMVEVVTDLINTLGLKMEDKVNKDFAKFFSEDINESTQVEFDTTVGDLKAGGITGNIDGLAKSVMFLRTIQDNINNGELTLVTKVGRGTKAEPVGKFVQPEGFVFKAGTNVRHAVYGLGTIARTLKDGSYMFKPKRGANVKSYPADVFSISGHFTKLHNAKKELAKAIEGSPRAEMLRKRIASTESTIAYLEAKKAGKSLEDVQDASVASLIETFEVIGLPTAKKKLAEKIGTNSRATKLSEALSVLEPLKTSLLKGAEDGVTEQTINDALGILKEAFIYSEEDIDGLLALVEEKMEDNKDDKSHNIKKHNLLFALKLKKALNKGIELGSVIEGTKFKKGKIAKRVITFDGPIAVRYDDKGESTGSAPQTHIQLAGTITSAAVSIADVIAAEYEYKNSIFSDAKPVVKKTTPKTTDKGAAKKTTPKKVVRKRAVKQKVKPQKGTFAVDNNLHQYNLSEPFLKKIEDANLDKAVLKEFAINLDLIAQIGGDNSRLIEIFSKDNLAKFKVGSAIGNERFNSEVAQVKRMLPQVKLEVVESVSKMVEQFGVKALGAYDRGVRYLVNNAEVGTAYHETFHAVADLYLTPAEKLEISEEMDAPWDIHLEEKLAEKFEKYAHSRLKESVGTKVKRFFSNLVNWVKGTRSLDVTTSIFNKIIEGGYATKESVTWADASNIGSSDMGQFAQTISQENSVLLQQLIQENKIKIVC